MQPSILCNIDGCKCSRQKIIDGCICSRQYYVILTAAYVAVKKRRRFGGLPPGTAAKCVGSCAGMGAAARRGRAQWRTTARGAYARPAHHRLKVQPPLLLNGLQPGPARKSETGPVSAATAQGGEMDVLGARSRRTSTFVDCFSPPGTRHHHAWSEGGLQGERLECRKS